MLTKLQPIYLILVLAFILRFLWGFSVPPSLNWDEASLGYNAYSILQTGKDEWGRQMPITFEAFGDFKLPGYVYSLVPFVALFGLNEFSVRLVSKIAGVLAVLLFYLLLKKITGNKNRASLGAFMLAVCPWHLFLSRVALEANLALTLVLAGFYFLISGFEKPKLLIISAFFIGVSLFTYNSARIFVPVFLFLLAIIYWESFWKLKKHLILPVLVLGFFIAIAGYLAVFEDSSSRYFWVSIVDQGAVNFLNESRGLTNLPFPVNLLVYNRYSYFFEQFVLNYTSYFSPSYLFFEGGSNHQFSVQGAGLLYLVELPLLLYGLWNLKKNKKTGLVFLSWLLVAPIPGSVTREAPHVLRSIFMIIPLCFFISSGLIEFVKYRKFSRNLKIGLITVSYLAGVLFFCYQYFVVYPQRESRSWQYGMKEVYSYLNESGFEIGSVKKVFITKRYGEAHIFMLFYDGYDPYKYQNNPTLVRYAKTNWRWVDRIDNYFFVNDWEIKDKLKSQKGELLVTSPGNFPDGSQILKSIYFLDGSKAFDVVKI